VADAQHAAIAIESASTWISRDGDFERFVPFGLRFEPWRP
jgi:predicted nucleic acid-binding protein